MLAKLDALARCHTLAPGLDMRVIAYRPVFWNGLLTRFKQYLEDNKIPWTGIHDLYILLCPLITSLDISKDTVLPVWAQGFILWYQTKTGDVIEDWLSFEQLVSGDNLSELWAGYHNTRDDLPKAPELLQQPAPVPVDDNGNLTRPIKTGGKKSR